MRDCGVNAAFARKISPLGKGLNKTLTRGLPISVTFRHLAATWRGLIRGCCEIIIMEAAEVTEKVRKHIANAYRLVFHGQTSLFDAINQIKDQVPDGPEIQNIIQFLESSEKGVITKM